MVILMLLFIVLALTLPQGFQAAANPVQTTMNRVYWITGILIGFFAIVIYIFRFGGTIAP